MSTHPALRAADLWRPGSSQHGAAGRASYRRKIVRRTWPELATELDALADRYTSPTGELARDQIAAEQHRQGDALARTGAIWLTCTAVGALAAAFLIDTTAAYLVMLPLATCTTYLAADAWWRSR